ncbi:CDC42 small effector protein 2 isoform X1 [Carcharodon carcharias]|uniref:CDC42 small effector protein 2 isoform X1 n=1 Tax=Carcharodon carcharias TaxID=13397 RepID=UPI001B7E493D|nr:CDC42 small effector protein 2 isoform X1 [Carcharodon carcharias]XP_041042616.1 CDC42 small effector protein 2 isoform X1 [Carcharodon carcharias]XP_041042617.1 CDC42 small effector protein 2 isoform X1 [Carcharodon carcharias]XP_041042618.1 CDC42 small effector protein 2 isoform X1 [Carcharodon carcharias]XP_041042619.1 CDC42 small effector protein 2 isoform X1 [Carcharodon carcharias]XP_041042620.1 CDC42 small effector protein 2 isoform X1 [Carcharodon carcharias]XP_041042621.1 CDC42 sm
MSEFWLCFNCCIAEQPQPKRRRRIDRSMIGEPTNFVHTAHVGSGDVFNSGMNSVSGEVGGFSKGHDYTCGWTRKFNCGCVVKSLKFKGDWTFET